MSALSIPQYNSNVGTSFTSFSHLIQQEISPIYFILEHAGTARLGPTLERVLKSLPQTSEVLHRLFQRQKRLSWPSPLLSWG
jgi:hypothetical protein